MQVIQGTGKIAALDRIKRELEPLEREAVDIGEDTLAFLIGMAAMEARRQCDETMAKPERAQREDED